MRRALLLGLGFVTAILAQAATAHAVPGTMGFTGRLIDTDTGDPINGPVTLTFRLLTEAVEADPENPADPVWTEEHAVMADEGLAFASLGTLTPLLGIFDGTDLWLEVTVNAGGTEEVLSPRLPIQSVPYAMHAGVAEVAQSLGADIEPEDVVTDVSGTAPLTADKTANSVQVGLAPCSIDGQILETTGDGWTCAPDNDTPPTAVSPLAVNGARVISMTGCLTGEIRKWNGITWDCAQDMDTNTTYVAGAGLSLLAGNAFAVDSTVQRRTATSPLSCNPGSYMRVVDGAGTTTCAPDKDTTYTGGIGISVAGTAVALNTTDCGIGEAWIHDGVKFDCTPVGRLKQDPNTTTIALTLDSGHIFTTQTPAPTVVRGSGIGPSSIMGLSPQSNDITGEVSFGRDPMGFVFQVLCSGTDPAPCGFHLATVTFARTYTQIPTVVVSARNSNASTFAVYAVPTTTGFQLWSLSTASDWNIHRYSYIVIGRG